MINSCKPDNEQKMPLDISHQINSLSQIAEDIAEPAVLAELAELREKLDSGRPNLVVVGLFKRGKSSLVNALLGCELAPVGITPLTAIVTTFEYHPERSFARIHFHDGRQLETDIFDFGPYVSEEDNPNNQKGVSIVRIFACNLPLLETMTLIDTPGLGSAHVHNTAATQAFIPRIDAALFVLSADLPVAEADILFLKELKKTIPTILFVLNKKDILRESDLQKLIAHDHQIIVSQVDLQPTDVDIIPVSTREYQGEELATGNIDTLTATLRSTFHKGDNVLLYQTLERRIHRLSDRLSLLVLARMETLRLPINELGKREEKLRAVPAMLGERKNEFDHLLSATTDRLAAFVRDTMQQKADELRTTLPNALATANKVLASDPTEQVQSLNQWVLDAFQQTHTKLEDEIKTRFQHALSQQARQPGAFLAELVDYLGAIMQLDFSNITEKFDLDVYAPFYLSSDGGASTPKRGSFLWLLLPSKVRARLLRQQLLAHFQEIIVRNAAAVSYNLEYRIQESNRKFSAELQRRLHELVNQMQKLLADTIRLRKGYAMDIDRSFNQLKEKLDQLQRLHRSKTTDDPIDAPINSPSSL